MQADALASIFDLYREEMATKNDLALLRTEIAAFRAEVAAGHKALQTEMATLKADLTWRFVASIGLFSTIMTLLDVFVK